MNTRLEVKNIVLLGDFQPNKFDKLFFIKHDIFTEDDFDDNSIFTTEFVQINSKNFSLFIVPNQIIFNSLLENFVDVFEKIIRSVILKLTAMGINLHYFSFFNEELNVVSRKLFYNENDKIAKNFFNDNDSNFGSYYSKNFKESRLKLEVKPVIMENEIDPSKQQGIMLAFNFHFVINNNSEALAVLADYKSYFEESIKIINNYYE